MSAVAWIETAARQALALEKQAEEIAALKTERAQLREKVQGLYAKIPPPANTKSDRVRRRTLNEVLALLDAGAEP